jgi:transposase
MSLPKNAPQPLLFGVSNLIGDCFAKDDPYRLFHEIIYPKLLAAREELAECYCQENGRPGREPVLLLGISILQFMEKQPDRQAMHMLKYHLGWKFALGQEVGLEAMDSSLLSYFRRRLLKSDKARLVFDAILSGLVEAGLVPRRGKRRLDSTHVLGLLADLSEAEKLQETMRVALEFLQKNGIALPEWSERMMERYVQSRPDWRMTKDDARAYCQKLGGDLLVLLDWLLQHQAELVNRKPLNLLQRVYTESFTMEDGALQFTGPQPGSLINPHEPEAKLGCKRDTRWNGFKGQVGETVPEHKAEKGEPTSAFITTVQVQDANEHDIKALPEIREAEKSAGLENAEQRFVDSAYISGAELREEKAAGGELMGEMQASLAEHPAKKEGFVISADGKHAVCPMGHSNDSCKVCHQGNRDVDYNRLIWSKPCGSCPRRDSCVGKNGERFVTTRLDYPLLHARREEQNTEQFKTQMRQRNGVEGTISELVRGYGLRRTRYRGKKKTQLWMWMVGAACNVNRWLRRMRWEMQHQAVAA